MRNFLGRLRSEAGVSLLELLIYIGIAGLVTASVAETMRSTMENYQGSQARLELKQEIRAAMNLISKDLRVAGCDPDPDDNVQFGFMTNQSQTVRVVSDFWPLMGTETTIGGVTKSRNYIGDNKFNGPGEDVTYTLSNGSLVRTAEYDDGLTHTETVLENVTNLQFNYLSAPGVAAAMAGAAPRGGAYFVEVIITAESNYVDRESGNPLSLQSSAMIHLRNMKYRKIAG